MIEEEKGDNNIYPTSIKSKIMIKDKLNQILRKMDMEHSLSDFAEDLEYETKGKFTFLELKEILDNKYIKLPSEQKIFLLKYIPLTSIGVNQNTPFITLINLFNYFEKITEAKIISPSLILYKTAETLQNKFHISTLEFVYSIGFYSTSVININEFYTKIATKLQLDDIACMIIFRGLDYKNTGKIKMTDFILVLDSYRDNSIENRYLYPQNMKQEEKNAKILKLFLDKNSISIDKLFEDGQVNYMDYSDLKNNIMKEISNNQNNFKVKDPINEKTVDSVLMSVSRNFKIFKDDLENFMQSTKIENVHNYLKLNDIQKYWIKRYIKILDSINITPKMAFESSAQARTPHLINLEDLKRQLHILLPDGRISASELNNMMDAFDINKNKTIERTKYDQIIKQINNDNKDKDDIQSNKEKTLKTLNDRTTNLWNTGIKSTSFHLLPVKGNYEVLMALNKDIHQNILLPKNLEGDQENSNNNNIEFGEEKIKGDQGVNYRDKNFSQNLDKNKNINIDGEYIDRHKLIVILENFSYHKIYFPIYDFLLYLSNNNISRQRSFEIIKYIDTDNDGYISILQVLNFVLKDLTFRSTKLLYKYLYLKVYQDLGFPSSEEFFTRYNFSIYDIINVNDLSKFYIALNIEMPLIMRSYEEIRNIFKPPYIYKNICELIDEYKNDPLLNNFGPSEEEEDKYSISINNFDLQMKNFVFNLLDKKDCTKDDHARAMRIHQKLKPIMKNCVEKMNLSQYNLFFSRPLNMEPILSMTIFQLLKTIMPNGEQLLDKNDLIMFLESYSANNDISNIKLNKDINKEDQKIEGIQKIVETIEFYSSPIKFAFESIPFRRNGMITSSELMKYLQIYYGNSISKNDLMYIIKSMDAKKVGFINYNQMQMFLYNFSQKYKYSINIELKLITCNIYKKGFSLGSEYFMSDDFKGLVTNYQKITKKQHFHFFKDICSSNKNRKELYYYLTSLSGRATYDIRFITDIVDGYLEMDYYNKDREKKEEKIKKSKRQIKEDEIDEKLPEQKVFEKALQNINLGDDGNVFMNQLLRQIPSDCQKTIAFKFDKKWQGYVPFPEFISICRDIYGTDINLNYKLCGQYIYKKFIKSPELIQSYLLNRINELNIVTYLTYDVLYSKFMYAFVNDKFLFEDFYNIYKEKKGKYVGMLNMHSFQQFIFYNNPELKAYPRVDFVKPSKDEISSQDNNIIDDLIKKKLISIREIIDLINVEESDLKKDFTISEEYMKKMLNKYFDYTDEEINIFCNYFRLGENKFNIKNFFLYDKETKNNTNIILNEEILPKIKEQILSCNISTYRQYRSKHFKGDFLTINEVYSKFNYLYHLTLFHCLLIIGDEQYLSIDKFYTDYELKDLFPEREYEPILKTAILKLNNYFEEHQDKLKLFKEIDLDKNGILSKEEFMTLLNSMDELNLEDNQKYKLLTVADKNKDGKINSREFLSFIKSAKFLSDSTMVNEMNSTFPNINKKIAINNTKFIPRYLNDKTIVEKNLEINKKIYKEGNGFLKAIIILQEDIVDNFFQFDSIEQDFNIADSEKTGKVSYFKFNSILKKRLFTLRDKNFEKFIKFANKGTENDEEQLNNENVIDYKNFLNNLINYNEEMSLQKSWESEEKKVEKEEKKEQEEEDKKKEEDEEDKKKEEEDTNKIKLGGTSIEESKIQKDEEDELTQYNKGSQRTGENIKDKNDTDNQDTRRNKEETEEKKENKEFLLDEENGKEEEENNKNEEINRSKDSKENKNNNNITENNNYDDDIKEMEENNNIEENKNIIEGNKDGFKPISQNVENKEENKEENNIKLLDDIIREPNPEEEQNENYGNIQIGNGRDEEAKVDKVEIDNNGNDIQIGNGHDEELKVDKVEKEENNNNFDNILGNGLLEEKIQYKEDEI